MLVIDVVLVGGPQGDVVLELGRDRQREPEDLGDAPEVTISNSYLK